jgi:oxygen-independent coproporphyrinogen-3 oxidase
MFAFTVLPPLSLYVHLPWCTRKCPYCDFNSHAVTDGVPENTYIDALLRDLEHDLPMVWGRSISSIYFGGGTPSLFSPAAIDRLLAGVRARIRLAAALETTLEANPGSIDRGKLAEFRHAGINRLSIGVQSFDDAALQRIGRIHDARAAVAAVEAARDAGLDNFNIDLMFGLPGQSLVQAGRDLVAAIELAPPHISYYQLTIEPNTLFHHRPPELPPEDTVWSMQRDGQQRLAAHGYLHYEVSAYAREGARCAHNLNYWTFGDYLGIGAGAHSKISRTSPAGIRRTWKIKHPAAYLEKAGSAAAIGGESVLTPDEALLDFMMNALRLTDGFDAELFTRHTGLAADHMEPRLTNAEQRGLVQKHHDCIRPTPTGQRYLNNLLAEFMD